MSSVLVIGHPETLQLRSQCRKITQVSYRQFKCVYSEWQEHDCIFGCHLQVHLVKGQNHR